MEERDNKGRFTEGHKGFKPKGATNVLNRDVKEKFEELLASYPVEEMINDLRALKPADRLHVVTGLLDFFIPKLNKTDHGLAITNEIIKVSLPPNNADRLIEP